MTGRGKDPWLPVGRWAGSVVAATFVLAAFIGMPAARAGATPVAPLEAAATASNVSTSVSVAWAPAATGPTPDHFLVVAFTRSTAIAQAVCPASNCRSTIVPGLTPGVTYSFGVLSGNRNGYSAPTMTQPVTVQAGCPGGAVCVQVDATSVTGPATLRADGLVAGPDSTDQTRTTLISALRPRWWRLGAGPSLGYGQYDAAAAFHPLSITEVLSGNWFQKTFSPTRGCGGNPVCYAEPQLFPSAGGAQPPWSNWAQYQSFIGGEVAAIGRSGRRVDYWDIQNEPPGTAGTGYFDQADTTSITLADEEEQIGVAYRAIKAVDPAAKVVCPSLVAFASYPGEYQPRDQLLDFTTLLDFLEKTHITCDALSWHENLGGPVPTDFNNQPDAVVAHVSLLRALLAQHPGVGHPLLFANEYGSPYTFSAPGWTAGHIAGLEAADVDQANRSCWSADGCDAGLDGLLVPGTTTPVSSDRRSVAPSASYWVQSFYAQMNGDVVPVSSSAEQVSSFATRDDATRILKVLLGRHESTGASMGQSGGAPPPRPNSVLLTIRIPWRTGLVRVGIQTIPNQSGPVDSPPVATALVAANNGSVQITLPVFSDGEARALTLQPA